VCLLQADVSARPRRTSRSRGAGLEVPAHHQARVRSRQTLPTALLGFLTLRRFAPDVGCVAVSSAAGLHAVRRSLAPIYFRRGTVRPKGKVKMLKRTGDHESSVRLPGLPPVIDPCRSALIARRGRSCLGLCLSQGCGHHKGAFERARPRSDHQPPETASGPYPLMGLTTNEMR